MKKNIFTKLAIFSLAATLFSCSSDENLGDDNRTKMMTFKATTEMSQKTVIDANDPTAINWQAGDQIKIGYLWTSSLYPQSETYTTNDGGSRYANFTGESMSSYDQNYYALYPGESSATFSNSPMFSIITLPATQTATDGSFDRLAAIMYAHSTDKDNLVFKNAVSYLKVTPSFKCTKIILTAHNQDNGRQTYIAGSGLINFNDATPQFRLISGSQINEIALIGDIKAGVAYYIALTPTTLTKGFTLTFIDDNDVSNEYTKSTSKNVTFERNQVLNVGTIGISDCILNNPACVDLGLPSGNLWATCNVGANNPEEVGSYFAWGETITKNQYDNNTGLNNRNEPLSLSQDAAYVNFGKSWNTPSEADFVELITNTIQSTETVNGKNCLKLTSKEDENKYILLPACGNKWSTSTSNTANNCEYMTVTNGELDPSRSKNRQLKWILGTTTTGNGEYMGSIYRYNGQCVRPVKYTR